MANFGKWALPIQCIGEFEIIVLLMEVALGLVCDYQFAHNIILLASKLYSDKRLKSKNQCFCSKIWSITKWPLSNLKCSNAFEIWYLNENKLIWDIWGHIGLKQPRNHKFKIDWAQAFSAEPDLNQNIDFISSPGVLFVLIMIAEYITVHSPYYTSL